MTMLAETPSKSIPWSALRVGTGALLLLFGLYLLFSVYRTGATSLVGIGVIVTCLGLATSFEKTAESVMLPVVAILLSFIPFGIFVSFAGVNPLSVLGLMYEGSFGGSFSFENTLTRAAPLMLTGLCTALPMRVGLVIIGGEGALIIGALFAAGAAHLVQSSPAWVILTTMLIAGFATGGLWISIAGMLKRYRGVNETISSLLLIYIAAALMNHLVEGPWRDPTSLNKPSSWPVWSGDDMLMGNIPGMDVHWGLVIGIAACVICWIIMNHTTFGFAARVVGGNVRAAKVAGLPLGRILFITCMMGGGAAGLAGAIEVAAVQGSCNATIMAGYGYAGILVAFLAQQNPITIIPVSILIGGIGASGGLLQRRLGLPNATVDVLQGTIFLMVLASETYYGRFKFFQKQEVAND
jgi:ABC-type uncharacterized transport system permease subunit